MVVCSDSCFGGVVVREGTGRKVGRFWKELREEEIYDQNIL